MSHLSDTQMAVTFCITELDVGGAEKAMVRIAAGLKHRGWTVRVISLRNEGPLAEPLITAGIPVTALECGGFGDVRALFRLTSALRTHPPDVLCCFLHQANIYGRLAARRAKIPVVVSGVRVADRRRWVTMTDRWTQNCTDQYIAVSDNVAALHCRLCHIPAAKMSSISNGVDGSVPREAAQKPSVQPHELLFVGRLTEQKAPLDLLEAYRRLPAELRESTRLTFVGEGPLRQRLQLEIASGGLANAVTLVGNSPDVPKLMQQATLLVLPSRWEGLPNVVLEAMANGLPVVATAVDGTLELISEGETGWLVPPAQPDALSAAIADALNNPDHRQAYSEKSQLIAVTRFSWNAAIDRYDQLLSSLVSKTSLKVVPENQI